MSGKNSGSARKAASVKIGGVELQAGFYLPSNSSEMVKKRPKKKEGYAYFDGETLSLCNYEYTGSGSKVGSFAVGIDVSNANTEIEFRGENIIEITGEEKSAALMINDGKLTIRGRGSLTLHAAGGKKCNFGMLGNGSVKITSGTVCLQAEVGEYTIGEEGERIYAADSYAVKVGKLVARLARIRGDDRDDDETDERTDINEMNKNNETEVIIDFPRFILWWWRRGCLGQLLLLLLALLALIFAIHYFTPGILEPDFNILDIDENIEEMEDEGEGVESSGGGGSVVLNFSYDITADLSEKKASLYFGLPSLSNRDAVLQLIVGDTLLAQSGRLPPGFQVRTLYLRDNAIRRLREGVYNGVLRVLYYNDETGERAILDTEIEVKITVTN